MGPPARQPPLSPEEYLAFERTSEQKHEYADGELFAMSGGSLAHSLLEEPRVEVYSRQPDESWILRTYGPGERVSLPSVDCSVALDSVYAGVLDARG